MTADMQLALGAFIWGTVFGLLLMLLWTWLIAWLHDRI
jgi:hypothetical protein